MLKFYDISFAIILQFKSKSFFVAQFTWQLYIVQCNCYAINSYKIHLNASFERQQKKNRLKALCLWLSQAFCHFSSLFNSSSQCGAALFSFCICLNFKTESSFEKVNCFLSLLHHQHTGMKRRKHTLWILRLRLGL